MVFRLHADLLAGEKDGDPEGLPVPGVINPLNPGQRQMLIRLINLKSEIKLNDGERGTETLGDWEEKTDYLNHMKCMQSFAFAYTPHQK